MVGGQRPAPDPVWQSVQQAAGTHEAALEVFFPQGGNLYTATAAGGMDKATMPDIDTDVVDPGTAARGKKEQIARLQGNPGNLLTDMPLLPAAMRQLDANACKNMLHQTRAVETAPPRTAHDIRPTHVGQRSFSQGLTQGSAIRPMPGLIRHGALNHPGPWQNADQGQESQHDQPPRRHVTMPMYGTHGAYGAILTRNGLISIPQHQEPQDTRIAAEQPVKQATCLPKARHAAKRRVKLPGYSMFLCFLSLPIFQGALFRGEYVEIWPEVWS